jgi:hypothetical protein
MGGDCGAAGTGRDEGCGTRAVEVFSGVSINIDAKGGMKSVE